MNTARERHVCTCPNDPMCFGHAAQEWGGGEPDVCEPHDHLETEAEQRAAFAILEALEPLTPHERQKWVRYMQWRWGPSTEADR